MQAKLLVLICITAFLAGGCAGTRRSEVVIDPDGVDMGQFDRDLEDCRQIAKQVDQKAGAGAVGGALVGAAIGAIVGNSSTAARSAGVGAVLGGAGGAGSTHKEKKVVVKNCMRDRGYNVLN